MRFRIWRVDFYENTRLQIYKKRTFGDETWIRANCKQEKMRNKELTFFLLLYYKNETTKEVKKTILVFYATQHFYGPLTQSQIVNLSFNYATLLFLIYFPPFSLFLCFSHSIWSQLQIMLRMQWSTRCRKNKKYDYLIINFFTSTLLLNNL